MNKALSHLHTINKHKLKVTWLCFRCHLYKQGLLHDLSKYSYIELKTGFHYYQGFRSPIDAEKEEKGYSLGWLHHKGRNKHHYEYWEDNFDNGGQPIEMPLKYKKEMLCDYLGAGKAYYGKSFTFEKELQWWNVKKSKPIAMHPNDKAFIDKYMNMLCKCENSKTVFEQIKKEGK